LIVGRFSGREVLRLDSRYLLRLKREAMWKRIWYKVLSNLERGLVDSIIKAIRRPRSPTLIMVLAKIVVKVKRALLSPLAQLMEVVGRPLAKRISMIAYKWGYERALEWSEDKGFIRYLVIIDVNNPPGFRLSEILLQRR